MLTKFLAFLVVVLTVILSILWLTNIFPARAMLVFQTEVISATLRDLLLLLWGMVIVLFLLGWVLSSFFSWFSSFWRIFASLYPYQGFGSIESRDPSFSLWKFFRSLYSVQQSHICFFPFPVECQIFGIANGDPYRSRG